ncbi:MAG: hypothetical protein AB7Q81_21475 [Gammaproteobacteria bacterium]
MKNRNWICYTLDYAGIVALVAAGIALVGAYRFSGSVLEGTILTAFTWCLAGGVGSFLVARICEITWIMNGHVDIVTEEAIELPSNVEHLPERRRLPRAA